MATNLAIDDSLVEQAVKIGGHRTKREAVNEALREYIQYRKQLGIIELFGTVEYYPDYEAKKARRKK